MSTADDNAAIEETHTLGEGRERVCRSERWRPSAFITKELFVVSGLVLAVMTFGIVNSTKGETPSSDAGSLGTTRDDIRSDASRSGNEPDAGAKLACTHFRNVAGDVSAGILTLPEVRDKLREVYDTARVSSAPGIATGAQEMLAAITAGDLDDLARDVRAFAGACNSLDL
jgi:hypothetical protein